MGRSESGTDASPGWSNEVPEHTVTVNSFYLDKYEVTVGRFREFVQAYDGTPPAVNAGAHASIGGTGWDPAWDESLPSTQASLVSGLDCGALSTWTNTVGANETRPINCVSWYEAMAFCVWDGGRLPTEAEWEYATAGGNENRLYPWGAAVPDCNLANFTDCSGAIDPVGSHTGVGRWGHEDLSGNLLEWTFDWWDQSWYEDPAAAMLNACNLTPSSERTQRNGHFASSADALRAVVRGRAAPTAQIYSTGLRCARNP